MENRNVILSRVFRARTWVAVLIAMQLVFVIPMTSDEAEATTWDAPYIVASGSVLTQMAMAVEADNVYCVYVQDNRGIYSVVMRWYDGSSWSSMLTVSLGTSTDARDPDIAVSNGTAHITYVDSTDRDADVMYRSYNGSYFTTIQQVSNSRGGENAYDPAIAADGDHVFIVWEEITVSDWDIHYRYIFEGSLGVTSALSTDIANDRQADPAIAMDDGKAHVVWTDSKNGDADIYYRMWNGASWATEVNLIPSADGDNQEYPDVDVEGDDVYVVFRHQTGGTNYGIDMVTFANSRWGTPNGVPGPAGGTEHLPRLGVEAGHVALVYLNIDRYYSAYFQHYDGQSWDSPEALETGNVDHVYWPSSVELLNGRAHAMVYDEDLPSKIHRYYVADVDDAEPSAEVEKVSPYWMTLNRLTLGWSASDDYALDSVTVQYRYSEDKNIWSRWTSVTILDGASGKDAFGTVSFMATDGEGFYEFKAWAKDISGRSEAPTMDPEAEAALDITAPTGSIVINGGDEYTTDQMLNLTMTWNDTMTELNGTPEQVSMQLSLDGVLWEPWTPALETLLYAVQDTDGVKSMFYRVKDAAGLVSETYNDTIYLDKAAPNGTITINEGDDWTKSVDVTLTLSSQDGSSGVAEMRISNEAIGGDEPWENPLDTKQWTLPEGEGTATVYYQVRDYAGLLSEVYSASISLDTVAPTGSIVINDGDETADDPTVTLTLTYEDATSGVSKVRFMDEAVGGDEPWDNPVETKEWDLGETGGVMTVYFQVMDLAGHVSEVYSDTIMLDTDKPTGTIDIEGDYDIVSEPNIMLLLTYDDETSAVVGIRVTNEAVGGDEPWDNPVETREWELTATDGEKTVYYQVLDASGQVSSVYTLVLILDTSNPYVDVPDPEDGSKDEKADVDIVVRFSKAMDQDTTSDATSMYYIDKDGNTVTVPVNFSWSPDSKTMTIEPRSDLKHSTEYTWEIAAGATEATMGATAGMTMTTTEPCHSSCGW